MILGLLFFAGFSVSFGAPLVLYALKFDEWEK